MLKEKRNKVAIWIGNLSKNQFSEYIEAEDYESGGPLNQFAADMGTHWYDSGLLGGNFQPNKQLPIKKLIHRLAYSASFSGEVVKAAEGQGFKTANCVVSLLGHEVKVRTWPASSPLTFLGNFSFSDEE